MRKLVYSRNERTLGTFRLLRSESSETRDQRQEHTGNGQAKVLCEDYTSELASSYNSDSLSAFGKSASLTSAIKACVLNAE